MEKGWIEVNTEKTRIMSFKSSGLSLELTNVTHFKIRGDGRMLKCDQGIVYFEPDDISYIVSDCEDWIV